jgi:hypothetical protein
MNSLTSKCVKVAKTSALESDASESESMPDSEEYVFTFQIYKMGVMIISK